MGAFVRSRIGGYAALCSSSHRRRYPPGPSPTLAFVRGRGSIWCATWALALQGIDFGPPYAKAARLDWSFDGSHRRLHRPAPSSRPHVHAASLPVSRRAHVLGVRLAVAGRYRWRKCSNRRQRATRAKIRTRACPRRFLPARMRRRRRNILWPGPPWRITRLISTASFNRISRTAGPGVARSTASLSRRLQ